MEATVPPTRGSQNNQKGVRDIYKINCRPVCDIEGRMSVAIPFSLLEFGVT
jgi:hypothetical protein